MLRLLTALVAGIAVLSLRVSAWAFTPDHPDGLYTFDESDEPFLLQEWNTTAHADEAAEILQRDRSPDTSLAKRQAFPAGQTECGTEALDMLDVVNCVVQAETACGPGNHDNAGKMLQARSAYAWKAGYVIVYVCNWWYSEIPCWDTQVATMVNVIQNWCGPSPNADDSLYSGWYKIDDWGIGVGIGPLGGDSCPGLGGNWAGDGTNPS